MKAQQLKDLENRCLSSMSEAEAFIDTLTHAEAAALQAEREAQWRAGVAMVEPKEAIKKKGLPLRPHMQVHSGLTGSATDVTERFEVAMRQIGELLGRLGLTNDLKSLVKGNDKRRRDHLTQHGFLLPGSTYEDCPISLLTGAANAREDEHIDNQALACLRLLQPRTVNQKLPWLRGLVQERLSKLLLEYPALMHPRWSFAFAQAEFRTVVPSMPMAMALASTQGAALPSLSHDLGAEQLRAFANHPCTAAGLTRKSAVANKPSGPRSISLADLLGEFESPRCAFAASLLRLERLSTGGHSYLGISQEQRSGVKALLSQSLADAWIGTPTTARMDLVMELRASEMARDDQEFRSMLPYHVPRVFIDPARSQASAGANPNAGALPAHDPVDRIERQAAALVDIRAASSAEEAQLHIFRWMFPRDGDDTFAGGVKRSTAVSVATVEVAARIVTLAEQAGMDFDEIGERIKLQFDADGDSSWAQIVRIEQTRRGMEAVIADAARAAASTSTSRRRMRSL